MARIRTIKPSIPSLNGRTVQLPPKQANAHYRRPEHVRWSHLIRQRANFTCQGCGTQGVRLFADHIMEIRDGGTWDLSNGQALCGSCHTSKTITERAKRAFARG